MKKSYFVNYENGVAKLATYRVVNAAITDLEDVQRAIAENSEEFLTASVDQEFYFDDELKIATFSGINCSAEKGFDICKNEIANNVISYQQGLNVWGLQDDLMIDIA